MNKLHKKNIVVIGGGTGTSTLLEGLKRYSANLSVIVSTADDGGSSGVLRKKFGVVPPGDIRQCLGALAEDPVLGKFFSYRFDHGELTGHTIGNLILAGLEKRTKNIQRAIALCAELLDARGQVIPVTLKSTSLIAILENGKKIVGEHAIEERRENKEYRIKNVVLKPGAKANPQALQAIKKADCIVFGPGDVYTSIMPNLIVPRVAAAVKKSSAKKIYITNIMTRHGQTDGFTAADFIREFSRYVEVDVALVNNCKPNSFWLRRYKKEHAGYVSPETRAIEDRGVKVIAADLLSEIIYPPTPGDRLTRSLLRHNSGKLASLIWKLI